MSTYPTMLAEAAPRFAASAIVAPVLFGVTFSAFVGTEVGQNMENLAVRGAELRSPATRAASLERLRPEGSDDAPSSEPAD